MERKLYVGNLLYSMEDDELREAFEEFGTVVSANIVLDHETGRSRGFGFVEMSTVDEAASAIESMNGIQLDGRTIRVNVAHPRKKHRRGSQHRRRDNDGR
jgi:RNA recognition motif-containing protein